MKKLLLSLLLILGITITASAQVGTCKVTDDRSNSTVSVCLDGYDGNQASFSISTDASTAVNVTFEVSYLSGTATKTRTVSALAQPNQTVLKSVSFPNQITSIKKITVTGARCQ